MLIGQEQLYAYQDGWIF